MRYVKGYRGAAKVLGITANTMKSWRKRGMAVENYHFYRRGRILYFVRERLNSILEGEGFSQKELVLRRILRGAL